MQCLREQLAKSEFLRNVGQNFKEAKQMRSKRVAEKTKLLRYGRLPISPREQNDRVTLREIEIDTETEKEYTLIG